MASARSTLKVAPRAEFGSRTARRLRGQGLVLGVVYSGGSEATPFQASEREVRSVISEGAALFDLEIDGGKAIPVVVKDQQLHPVRGSLQHIDLQAVKLDEAIEAEVAIELEGAETAPGVKGGGVLEHVTFMADDPEEVTIVTLSPPRVEEEPEPEVEEETELVGEGEGEAEGDTAEGDSGDSEGE